MTRAEQIEAAARAVLEARGVVEVNNTIIGLGRAWRLPPDAPIPACERDRALVRARMPGMTPMPLSDAEVDAIIASVDRDHPPPAPSETLREWALAFGAECASEGAQLAKAACAKNQGEWPSTTCENCDGDGSLDDHGIESACPDCDGTGSEMDSASQMADALDVPALLARIGPPPDDSMQIAEAVRDATVGVEAGGRSAATLDLAQVIARAREGKR